MLDNLINKMLANLTNKMLPNLKTTVALVVGGSVALVGLSSFTTIPTGHVGFKNLFGEVYDKEYYPGFTFINPVSSMIKLDLRKKITHTESAVTSIEGLNINVEVDIVHRLNKENAKNTYINVGDKYINILLIPQLKSCVRDAISGYYAKDLYHDKTRLEIKDKILSSMSKMLDSIIIVDDVLINKIELPSNLRSAIEVKLQAEQEMQKMEFTLEKERKEAERKKIEATGIKDFQDTVAKGISKELLEWKGIKATEELAKSNNSKIVVIGNSKNGLPVIFSDNKN